MFFRRVTTRLLTNTATKTPPITHLFTIKRNMSTENKQNTTWVKDIKEGEFVRKGRTSFISKKNFCVKLIFLHRKN